MISGTKAAIGTAASSPSRPRPHPHWKTATSTPYAAPIESRFITAALSGTRIDRNTMSNRTNAPSTTKPMQSSSRELIRSVRSMSSAVWPPTCTAPSMVVPRGRGGDDIVAQRAHERLGRLGVGSAVGLHDDDSRIELLGSEADRVTSATPGTFSMRATSASTADRSELSSRLSHRAGVTVRSNGPLAPGPKPSAIAFVSLPLGQPLGVVAVVGEPELHPGSPEQRARGGSRATSTRNIHGRFAISRAQSRQNRRPAVSLGLIRFPTTTIPPGGG